MSGGSRNILPGPTRPGHDGADGYRRFLDGCTQRFARSTVADIAGSIRCFARFLLATGRISIALANSVISPVQPKFERPRRALPWEDVQRLLRAVDKSSARGLRDYALLLMMSTYGLRSRRSDPAEVRGHRLDGRHDQAGAAKDRRGLHAPPVAGGGRGAGDLPARRSATEHTDQARLHPDEDAIRSAELLVAGSPYLVKHARVAGLNAPYLGSHVLRFSNAARQVDLGIHPRVLSDLLGHRDPKSISAYVRIATETLRDISLPVPT